MISKTIQLLLVCILAVIVTVIAEKILINREIDKGSNGNVFLYGLVGMLPGLIIFVIGYFMVRKGAFEGYQDDMPSGCPCAAMKGRDYMVPPCSTCPRRGGEGYHDSGINQVINIVQNCDGGKKPSPSPSPAPPSPPKVTIEALTKWVKGLEPALTDKCVVCIVASAKKLWSGEMLSKVESLPVNDQKTILNALLAFQCDKSCVVPVNGLNSADVMKWVSDLIPTMPPQCRTCVVNSVLKLWTPDEYTKVLNMPASQQQEVVQAMILLNCPTCDTNNNNLNPADVNKWIAQYLPKILGPSNVEQSQCYTCAYNTIMKMWSPEQFAKVQAMDDVSQSQILQAIVALDCNKNCIAVPSGLTDEQVYAWITSLETGAHPDCYSCLVNNITMRWSETYLNNVKKLPKGEQIMVLIGLTNLYCKEPCRGAEENEYDS